MSKQGNAATAGLSMGSALAMILSFQLNHSILWAIVHGISSWFYVIYHAYKGELLTSDPLAQAPSSCH
jgi:hypothetical protein